jgi:hypothetical protein
MKASGKTTSFAPPAAASPISCSTLATVASRSMITEAACTTATRVGWVVSGMAASVGGKFGPLNLPNSGGTLI